MSDSEANTAGPAAGEAIVVAPQSETETTIIQQPDEAPAPVAVQGEVVLAVDELRIDNFDPSIEGCPAISKTGTAVPSEFADRAISIGAANGVSIVKR